MKRYNGTGRGAVCPDGDGGSVGQALTAFLQSNFDKMGNGGLAYDAVDLLVVRQLAVPVVCRVVGVEQITWVAEYDPYHCLETLYEKRMISS